MNTGRPSPGYNEKRSRQEPDYWAEMTYTECAVATGTEGTPPSHSTATTHSEGDEGSWPILKKKGSGKAQTTVLARTGVHGLRISLRGQLQTTRAGAGEH